MDQSNITWVDYGDGPFQGSDKTILLWIDADYTDDMSNTEYESWGYGKWYGRQVKHPVSHW